MQPSEPSGAAAPGTRPWWERRPLVAVLILLALVPLLYPPVPPLVDLFGHMGRYRVQLDLGSSPWLREFYTFRWAAIGNLGVDLAVMPLAQLVGLETAVKLIVLAIPPLTVAGFLWVAREVHHRLPPTAMFALPFVFGHPFMFGFVNFALSMAFAFLAFGLWLRLARLGKLTLRAWLFVPISIVVFFTHTFGWGTLGLLCFSAEAVRQHDRGTPWFKAGVGAALHAAVMSLPVAIMLAWRRETHGRTAANWFDWDMKLEWIASALRDRWALFDYGSLLLAFAILVFALLSKRLTLSRNLAFSALVLLAGFILLPWTVFGSAYADMRLVPYLIAVALLAIRFRTDTHLPTARVLAALALAFVLVRLAGTTASLAIAADDQRAKLAALDHVPMGARVASLVGIDCTRPWPLQRNSHLGSMVIVRREGFSNDQWVIEGANLLGLRYRQAGAYAADPSQLVRANRCGPGHSPDDALKALPRDAFDYVWMIDVPPFDPRSTAGMRMVWRGPGSILYQVRP
ncbi:hypothetical protein [Sphingomonas sp.]|uniref:hypothetical protein n=1 Tax=Sphingomonas sp. TaxID=28214 RepID=UPI00286DEA01|nr:hypothetical protein [Sphingomonas sp.]